MTHQGDDDVSSSDGRCEHSFEESLKLDALRGEGHSGELTEVLQQISH